MDVQLIIAVGGGDCLFVQRNAFSMVWYGMVCLVSLSQVFVRSVRRGSERDVFVSCLGPDLSRWPSWEGCVCQCVEVYLI